MTDELKFCKDCGNSRPVSEFGRNKRSRDGMTQYCREHMSARSRDYYSRNQETCRSKAIVANAKRGREYWREVSRRWNEHNAEKHRAWVRQWIMDNPEKARELARISDLNRRARELEAFVEQVAPLILFQRDEGMCGICGKEVDMDEFHVDHIVPLAKGGEHSYNNTQIAHPQCNRVKGTKMPVPVPAIAEFI